MYHTRPKHLLIVLMALLLISPTLSHADDDEVAAKPKIDMEMIDTWVAELDHDRLTKRQQARTKLLEAGKAAIPALAKAALSGKREMIEKSIDVLAKLTLSEDKETEEAATVTLQMLSESEQPSTAERAKIALNTEEAGGIKPFEGWDKPNSEFARGGGGGYKSVSVSNVNGIRTINVKESGIDTTIQEQPGGDIRRISGGDKPIEFVAKDAEDLKKQNLKASELYQQYAGGNVAVAGINLLGNGLNIGNANQTAVANAGQQAIAIDGNFQGGNANASKLLKQQLEELKKRMAGNPEMEQMLDQQINAIDGK